ncbi:hypothetical protein NEISICOT_01523 [Neisseria sicca ATCC 29256]|uniref:Uncharacterized protein n=1 Tax=Neisseria sicca ATCC 29256 TaxID=547045 RepID=C6M4S5_NEISI|nr:hypothetical protein NEISICOT_01523 [Neisseria sicca ATCC 29256]
MLAKFVSLVFSVRSLLTGQPFRRPFRRFFAKPRNLNVSLRLTALSLTLSHGEREQIGRNPNKEREQIGRIPKNGWVSASSNLLSHEERRQNWRETQSMVGLMRH